MWRDRNGMGMRRGDRDGEGAMAYGMGPHIRSQRSAGFCYGLIRAGVEELGWLQIVRYRRD